MKWRLKSDPSVEVWADTVVANEPAMIVLPPGVSIEKTVIFSKEAFHAKYEPIPETSPVLVEDELEELWHFSLEGAAICKRASAEIRRLRKETQAARNEYTAACMKWAEEATALRRQVRLLTQQRDEAQKQVDALRVKRPTLVSGTITGRLDIEEDHHY